MIALGLTSVVPKESVRLTTTILLFPSIVAFSIKSFPASVQYIRRFSISRVKPSTSDEEIIWGKRVKEKVESHYVENTNFKSFWRTTESRQEENELHRHQTRPNNAKQPGTISSKLLLLFRPRTKDDDEELNHYKIESQFSIIRENIWLKHVSKIAF